MKPSPRTPHSPVPGGPPTRGVRTGGRSQRVVAAVLEAAAAELAARGYVGFRMEDVATAAGVNKTTIYRRWPTKGHLVEATLRSIAPATRRPPRNGSLEQDLLALLRGLVRWKRDPRGASILRALYLEANEPDLREIVARLRAETLRPWLEVIDEGKRRGELPAGTDAYLVAQMVLAPTMARLHHRPDERVDAATLAAIVGVVVAGFRARAKPARARRGATSPRRSQGR